MELKDIVGIVGLIITAISSAVGVYKLFKDVSWFLPKATKYSHFIEKYHDYLDPLEIEFMEAEMKKDIKKSILGIKKQKERQLVLYVRTHSELMMPSWRWGYLVPHIQLKYGRFFIRYKGKYILERMLFNIAAIFYAVLGLIYPFSLFNENISSIIFGVILMLICLCMALFFGTLLPRGKIIKQYNKELSKIDASNYQAG